jgi:4-hydroxy-3-methylbut-2-enyl diphosphate reductase
LIDSEADIEEDWFAADDSVERIGVTAGASTPQFLVEAVIRKLMAISGGNAEVALQERRKEELRDPMSLS